MEIAGPGLMSGGRIIKKKGFFLFLSLALVGVSSCHPYIDDGGSFFGKNDCIAHYQYIAYIPNNVDSVKIKLFDRTKTLEQEEYSMLGYYKDFQFFWGPSRYEDTFDTLFFKLYFFCNALWVESRDYKFPNRRDVVTHINYKEQSEGELMFDAELDSICPGLSNYRISQYTDDECLDELNGSSD